jgi:hypothetical protein
MVLQKVVDGRTRRTYLSRRSLLHFSEVCSASVVVGGRADFVRTVVKKPTFFATPTSYILLSSLDTALAWDTL